MSNKHLWSRSNAVIAGKLAVTVILIASAIANSEATFIPSLVCTYDKHGHENTCWNCAKHPQECWEAMKFTTERTGIGEIIEPPEKQ